MLGTLDAKVQTFLHVLRRKGGMVNTVAAIAKAKALIARSQDEHFKCIDLESTSWAKSLSSAWDLKSEHVPHRNRKSQNWQKRRLS